MTDVALTALMKHCLSLEEINFSWTSLKSIPKYVVCLKRLHKLNIEDCAKLTYPSPDVLNKGLDGLIDFYLNYCLNFRLKIFVLGDLSSGKTSMVQNLVGNSSISLPNPTDGVNIQTWYPFKENSQNVALIGDDQLTDSEKCLRLEIWDLSGRPVTQGAHQVYMTRDALYIIVFNVTDQASCDGVAKFVDAVEARSPGSLIILVSTRSDKIVSEEKRRSRNKSVMQSIVDNEKKHVTSIKEEMDRLRQGPVDMKTLRRIEDLEYLLYRRPRFAESVISVSNTTGKGIETLRRVVLTRALDIDIYPHTVHQVTPNGLQLYDELNQLSRCEGKVVISWEEYHNVAFRDDKVKCEDDLETETYFLHATGAILDVRFTCYPDDPNSRYICLNPAAVASAICGLHVDDNKKSFKFEARRFWPKESGYCKPDPGILVRALEEIPANGFVRETLLPLLWQETKFSADQILMMIQLLYRLGILAPLTSLSDQVDELELPYYQSLSVTRKHFVPLLNLLPDNKPQLNWTPKPFKGDIQINWRYEFPIGYPPGCMERLLACCHQAKNAESYQHTWKYGMLLKICDALICINYEEAYFDICCRVNADEEGREKAAVETLWLHLSIFIHAVEKMLQEWRGVYWRISLVPFGAVFFKGDKLDCDPVFDFYECSIRSTREFVLTFLDGDKEHHLDLDLLMPNLAEDVTSISKWMKTMIALRESLIKSTSSLGTHSFSTLASSNGQHSVTSFVTRKNKKKNIEIKWKLDNEIEVPKRVENYAKTDVEIDPKIEKDNVDTDRDNMKETSKVMDITENGEITPEEGEKLLQGKVLTKDEESKEVDRVASGFVASILAQSVADYITSEYEDNKYESTQTLPLSNVVVTAAQAEAAKVTAEAAVATQSGDVDGAARAVLAAAKTVQQAVDKANANHSPNGKRRRKSSESTAKCNCLIS
ncbi:malignant fibrous histiocytoma-amplified sequence 1 homolog [Lineus longissimus]|uniref:malignant fibrous histiocytoma-amplified sequence 1 homolog n=1 Tax=Lineus longissimus TaxID=88925 RepID=UPI00315D7728